MRLATFLCLLASLVFISAARADDADNKPKVAVFPLAGSAAQDQRDKVGFSLRTKFDRDGHYTPIDGPTMADLAGEKVITLSTTLAEVQALAKAESPVVLIWGELDSAGAGYKLNLNVVDLRQKDPSPRSLTEQIKEPTDLRYVVEHVLSKVADVGTFYHPSENAVVDDEQAKHLWETNPNLVIDGKFERSGNWFALLESQKYAAPISDSLPATDKVVILRDPKSREIGAHNTLAMKLSRTTAENNGLACLSAPIPIEPNTRYRIQYKYKSDGPSLHVFVKGYYDGKNIAGEKDDVECYRCQVPPSGGTGGQWKTIICDINPQNISHPPTKLKVDLYAYMTPGSVQFDDVQVKAVGPITHVAADDAIKVPAK